MWLLLPLPVSPPEVTITGVTNSQVEYETNAHGNATRVIAGYEVTRFGVTMIGQYENTGRGSRVTISPAVPGAQYRITAWALGDGGRSATPTVVDATTGEAGALCEIVGTDFLHLSHFLPRYICYILQLCTYVLTTSSLSFNSCFSSKITHCHKSIPRWC